MELGNFSISLTVKDVRASSTFYEKLGFRIIEGDVEQHWVVMQNGPHSIGLFQGMFDRNMLTFNPGWDEKGKPMEVFTDIRDLRRVIVDRGVETANEEQLGSTGPGSFMVHDPDGNPILFDQHL